jgi:hypothetical protein
MPRSRVVTLTPAEVAVASALGVLRQTESLQSERRDNHGFDGSKGWSLHIEGVGGELAVAKLYGIYPVFGLNTFKDADLGKNIQVRTRSSHGYELLVREDDSDDAIFVCVTGLMPNYMVRGWLVGADAKKLGRVETYAGRTPAFFVDHDHLNDIDTLKIAPTALPARQDSEVPAVHPF